MRPLCGSALAIALVARTAAAAEHAAEHAAEQDDAWHFLPRGHVAYGIGGAIGELPGFRQGFDASVGVAAEEGDGAVWIAGGSVVTGFGTYPTYLSLDFGSVIYHRTDGHNAFYAGLFTLGPALRVDPSVRAGAEASATYCILYFELGLRALLVGGSTGDGQLEATIGFGLL
jgi:hypothetical protein